MKSILDRSFRYTSSVETDLRKTFARIRREQAQAQQPAGPKPDHTLSPEVRKVISIGGRNGV